MWRPMTSVILDSYTSEKKFLHTNLPAGHTSLYLPNAETTSGTGLYRL